MLADVLIPWRHDPSREDALFYVVERYEAAGCNVIIMGDEGEHPDLFNHGQAYNMAEQAAVTDLLVLGDADTTFDTAQAFVRAVENVRAGVWAWALPERYIQLQQGATDRVLARVLAPDAVTTSDAVWIGERVSWAGIVIVPRQAFLAVGGSDERFVGHGADDAALGIKLTDLYAEHVRYTGAAVHLWHPRGEQEEDRHRYADDQRRLIFRYMDAAGDPEAVRRVAGL